MYTKCYATRLGKNKFKIHLWADEGYSETEWWNPAYVECPESEAQFRGLKGEYLKKTYKWDKTTQGLHFHDMAPNQKFLIEKYGLNDEPSTSHREVFFDIECKIGGALTEEYISSAPMPITSIAWWDKQMDFWSIVVLDPKDKVKHVKFKNKEIIPCKTEEELLATFIEKFRDIDPDILIGYNCIPKTSRIWGEKEIVEIQKINEGNPLFGVSNRVLRYVSSKMKEQIEIRLDNGNTLKCSKEHIFPVYEKTSKYQSLIPLLKSVSDKSVEEMMGVNNPLYLEVVKGNNYNHNQFMDIVGGGPDQLIEYDDLYLLGLIFTDGWYHNEKYDKSTISISNSDKELIENIIPLINKNRKEGRRIKDVNLLTPHQSKIYPKSRPNYRLRAFSRKNNRGKFEMLKKFIYDGEVKSLNINLLSKLSKEQFQHFFSGCIDGDGGVNKQRIHFCNFEGNIHKVHELLLWNGVYSTIESNENILNIPYCNIFDNKCFIDSLTLRGYKDKQRKEELNYFEFNNKPSNNVKKYVLEDKILIRIKSIENTYQKVDMCDITTSTGYFTYEGIKTHNCDYFDIPYLYYRICNVLGYDWGNYLSPIGKVEVKKGNEYWFRDDYVNIVGVESLDYMRLHKKYYWRDEPNWSLNAIGEKWADISKIEYDGNLNNLYEDDIDKFIQYNFRDVEVLKKLDEKLKYIALTKNLAHKGKHNYSQVYKSSVTHDGAISAYLLSQGIIPPPRDKNPIVKKDYAGGYTYCPKAGLYRYMFDEDLTSLYPSIIMTINIGKETLVGRIIDSNDRNNRLGLNDLLEMDPESDVLIENAERKRVKTKLKNVIHFIQKDKLAVTANGVMFRTDIKSVLAVVLEKWFEERVMYKNEMKAAYKRGDKVKEDYYHLMQYSMKILLNSLYGATSLGSFRYGNIILSEAITLSGQRIIQESALTANRHINCVMRGEHEF